MEIEVGEYVRTKNGKIRKVKDTVAQYYITDRLNITDNNQFAKEDIVKHNKNIIDLIEVGDIVHTRDVLNEDIVYIWSEEYLKACKEDLNNGIELVEILTKEQYKQNCYTVERNQEC